MSLNGRGRFQPRVGRFTRENAGWIGHGGQQARTNLLQFPDEADNGYWSLGSCTIAANTAIGPDGANTMDACVPSSGSGSANIRKLGVSISSGATYTYSRALRNGSLATNWIELTLISSSVWRAWFNLATGAKGSNSGSPAAYDIVDLGGGLYRAYMTVVAAAATADVYINVRSADNSLAAITGDGSSPAFYTSDARLEVGAFA